LTKDYEIFLEPLLTTYDEYLSSRGIKEDEIDICHEVLYDVYVNSQLDIQFLTMRRLPNGVGKCKLAAILLFRLTNGRVLRFRDRRLCSHSALRHGHPSFDFSLIYVLKYVLDIHQDRIHTLFTLYKKEFDEIEYLIRKRHADTENIGMVFKFICRAEEEFCCDVKLD